MTLKRIQLSQVKGTTFQRYLSFILGMFVMILSGSLFSFASISGDLKARFGFSSSDINLLAAVGDTSMNVGFLLVGPIYDYYGGQWTMATGCIFSFLGYGGMYVAYARAWGGLGLLMVLNALAGTASTAGYLAALATNMANFSNESSGTVSGILLAFFGLSATLFSQIKAHIFSGQDEKVDLGVAFKGTMATQSFLLFLTIVTTSSLAIAAVFMVKVGHNAEDIMATHDDAESAEHEHNSTKGDLEANNASDSHQTTKDALTVSVSLPNTPVDMTPRQVIVSQLFWFFVLAMFLQQGFSYINNIDSIIAAVLDPAHPSSASRIVALTGLHVTIISVSNCIGRIVPGILSDWVIQRYKVSRSIFFLISETMIFVPLALMSRQVSLSELTISSCFIGFCYGSAGALFASLTRDFFGVKYYGTNGGLVMVLVGCNPIVANVVYGIFYDRASKLGSGAISIDDHGQQQCFGLPGVFDARGEAMG
ncbi:hypothetical protein BGZ94_003233 [Podila epigama]|nr:hypothetical protein BGZ94_003233 [Podila epigama]